MATSEFRADRRVAEEKLDRWLVKPTDGMYAQLNRRISIPISRQLIASNYRKHGEHLHTRSYFVPPYFRSGWILEHPARHSSACLRHPDGCDGEVARLKLLESDFGCWLETVWTMCFTFSS